MKGLDLAFDAEVARAGADLRDRRTTPIDSVYPRSSPQHHGAGTLGRQLLTGLVVVGGVLIAASVGLALVPLRAQVSPQGPAASTTGDYYPDGIPSKWQGEPVVRGEAAIRAANVDDGRGEFLVALWAGTERPSACVSNMLAEELDGSCRYLRQVGDSPGIPMPDLGKVLRFAPDLLQPGPAIVRVHTHDPQAKDCVSERVSACEQILVADAVVWNGDTGTAPKPFTVDAVAKAFGTSTAASGSDRCAGEILRVRVLPYQDGGVVAIFPSQAALIAAVPDAAHAEYPLTPPQTVAECNHTVTNPAGTHDLRFVWVARANVLIGVQYDSGVDAGGANAIVDVRQILSKLGSQ